MGSKLRFLVILFVVSDATPQPPPPPHDHHHGSPSGAFPQLLHNLGRNLERHRPLPDRPSNIGLPFFNDDNPSPHRQLDYHQDAPRFDPKSFDQSGRDHGLPQRPVGPVHDDNINTQKSHNDDGKIPQDHGTIRAKIITRLNEGLKKGITSFKHVQNLTKHSVLVNNTRNRQNVLKTSENNNEDGSRKTLVTSSTPNVTDAVKENKKSNLYRPLAETKLDSFNNVDSDLLTQIFGSAEDESSTTESTTEYETTTWDDFNRIGAPPAVVASLLG